MTTVRRGAIPAAKGTARGAKLSRKEQGERTRQAILDAAVELYADTGYRGTGLMAIGQRAGVHHATVLYHFGSARDLLIAALRERDRRLAEFARGPRREGGLAALRSLPLVAEFNRDHALWAKLFTVLQVENLAPDAPAHDYFVERRESRRKGLVQWLRDAKKRGEIRSDVDEGTTAETILAFTAGVQIQALLDEKRGDPVAVYHRFTAMLIRDLTRGRKSRVGSRHDDRSKRDGGAGR